jgi:hypothetical protein
LLSLNILHSQSGRDFSRLDFFNQTISANYNAKKNLDGFKVDTKDPHAWAGIWASRYKKMMNVVF